VRLASQGIEQSATGAPLLNLPSVTGRHQPRFSELERERSLHASSGSGAVGRVQRSYVAQRSLPWALGHCITPLSVFPDADTREGATSPLLERRPVL
jgi:hypothetical protein